MFNDTLAQKANRPLGVKQMVQESKKEPEWKNKNCHIHWHWNISIRKGTVNEYYNCTISA